MEQNFESGFTCPHCGSYVKQYRRSMNSNMALALLLLYKFNIRKFVKVEDFIIKNGQKRCGDFTYLTHYRFLEKQIGKRKDGSGRNGYYRITPEGIDFASGRTTAAAKFIMLHGVCQGFEGEQINIRQALGKKFNYDELMGDFAPKTDKEKQGYKQLSLI